MKRHDVIAMTRISLVTLVAGCATSRFGTIPLVPENLRPPATEVLSLETQATGVQIYECNASKDVPTRFEWVFKAPEADLFDEAGNKIGKHYAGPTWESNDGSKVVGEVKAQRHGSRLRGHSMVTVEREINFGDRSLQSDQEHPTCTYRRRQSAHRTL